MKLLDLTGNKYGKLTVTGRAPNKNKNVMWHCVCACGNKTVVKGEHLKSGHTKSCGCLRKDTMSGMFSTHKQTGTSLYRMWHNMKVRCYYEQAERYSSYGARGITVCDEWRCSFESFRNWACENGYEDGLSIERKDINRGYSPDNCTFVSLKNQYYNKTNTRYIEYLGETKSLAEWSNLYGIPYDTLLARIDRYGWSIDDALTIAVGSQRRHCNVNSEHK